MMPVGCNLQSVGRECVSWLENRHYEYQSLFVSIDVFDAVQQVRIKHFGFGYVSIIELLLCHLVYSC